MELHVTSVDYAAEELYDQVPLVFELLRQVPGPDRPDYWIGKCQKPIAWLRENHWQKIEYVVVAARWEGTKIEPSARDLPIGISYIIDSSVLEDESLDFSKCEYVAIGISHETSDGHSPKPLDRVLGGTIGRFIGKGNQ